MAEHNPLTAACLWGDEQFADATVVMGDVTWKVHRWVLCRQSEYFMKALEGNFIEAANKTVVLPQDDLFAREDVDALLRFLYFNQLQQHQKADPLAAWRVADYFQAPTCRAQALAAFKAGLKQLVDTSNWRVYLKYALKILQDFDDGTEIDRALLQVAAENVKKVLHDSGVWDEIVGEHPAFAGRVLKAVVPREEPAGLGVGAGALARAARRPAGAAFDDVYRGGQEGRGRGGRGYPMLH